MATPLMCYIILLLDITDRNIPAAVSLPVLQCRLFCDRDFTNLSSLHGPQLDLLSRPARQEHRLRETGQLHSD